MDSHLYLDQKHKVDLVVVGAGAAGFMAAITAAEEGLESIHLLEATTKPLEKVRISGGGRCNVTHAAWDPRDLVDNYPRGNKPLRSAFSRFAAGDAVAWFSEHGLQLVEEKDGRMFPITNKSDSVVNCFRDTANSLGISLRTEEFVRELQFLDNNEYLVICNSGYTLYSKNVLLATGGHPSGRRLANNLGHNIIPSIPSLFSFKINDKLIRTCSGYALDNVSMQLNIDGKIFQEYGRMLFTHWGFSGPIVLKLSSFAARWLYRSHYQAKITIDWIAKESFDIKNIFAKVRREKGYKTLFNFKPFENLSKRFWLTLLQKASIDFSIKWSDLSLRDEIKLIQTLTCNQYLLIGKGPFGDEFVTAGGVDLNEVNFKNMESRLCKGLYFAGEVLDVDGLTGGFNFQHCWTSAWLAGRAIASSIR